MARNIEVKVRVDELSAVSERVRSLCAGRPIETFTQDDTFFSVPRGRLKLREFADGSAELIHYDRPDLEGLRVSDYVRVPVADAASMRTALLRACGSAGRVRKTRQLALHGRTRIHLDHVEGLGEFVELEVVLAAGDDDAGGHAEAMALLAALGLADARPLPGAYLDLLAAKG